jgi:hypothetical protein
MSAPPQILHRRDREALTRFIRMILASLLVHGLLIVSANLVSRRSSAASFRENSITVTFRERPKAAAGAVAPPAAPAPSAAIPALPAPARPATPSPARPAKAEKVASSGSGKAPAKSVEKILPKDATKSEVKTGGKASSKTGPGRGTQVTRAEQAAMDSALEKIRRGVAQSESGAAQAVWDAAMAAAEASLQVQDYRRQAGQKLSDAWTPPVGVPALSVRVLVRVRPDGTLAGYEIIQRSGEAGLDASVERIFAKVKKLDLISWTISGATLTLGFEFQAEAGGQ